MKFQTTILPVAALAAVGSALVIPEMKMSKMPCHKSGDNAANNGGVAKETKQETEEKSYVKDESKSTNEKEETKKHGDRKRKGGANANGHSKGGKVSKGSKKPGHKEVVYPKGELEVADISNEELQAAMITGNAGNKRVIPHRYIIVFKQHAESRDVSFHKELIEQAQLESAGELPETDEFFVSTADSEFSDSLNGGIKDTFDVAGLLSGYVGYFTDSVVEMIRRSPLVDFVEQDSLVFANDFDTQNGAPWGLSRISHRDRLNLGSFNKYLYDDQGGKGVTSYVIDTGINVKHNDFENRAKWGKTVPVNDEDADGNGHGTHCAGTIASKHYGVAKQAEVVAVKVLRSNGSGSMSDVIKGVEFAAESHQKAAKENKKGFKGSTANMSLGGGKSPALDLAVNAAVKAGIHFAVAAGNENQDACDTSPAGAEGPITVGASTLSDDRAYFSNWGKCVDIFAPGLNILSTYIGSDDATATLSGTSMASPHVAGLLTYLLALQPGEESAFGSNSISPEQMKKRLVSYSTKDILIDLPSDTPNALIYNGGGQDLSDFWGGKSLEGDERAKDFDFRRIGEQIGSKTDNLFDDIRSIVDKLNII